jgi:hypothetical protein
MAKRSSRTLNSEYARDTPVVSYPTPNLGIDPTPQLAYNKVRNLVPSRVIRYVNDHRYEWSPGQSIPVLLEDVHDLLNLKIGGTPCCGQTAGPMFEVSED